jgi:ParB/RepB/Spo0J family partition protein
MSKNSPTASATYAAMPDAKAYPDDKIHNNPWQPRQTMDPAGLQELADDFKRNGLLQLPEGRPHPTISGAVELSLGHRRRKAWFIAFPNQPMPIILKPLTDLQMYQHALAENGGESGGLRQALSIIEIAQAIQCGVEDFGLTQLQAGELLGYKSQGTVSNVLRILQLPAPIRTLAQDGQVPQRHIRELIPIARISPNEATKIALAISKANPRDRDETLASEMDDFLRRKGRDLKDAAWPSEWPAEPIPVEKPKGEQPQALIACEICPLRFKRDENHFCANPACFELKQVRGLEITLANASKRLGVAVAAERGEKTEMVYDGATGGLAGSYWTAEQTVKKLMRANLSGLRLAIFSGRGPGHYRRSAFGSPYLQLRVVASEVEAIKQFVKAAEQEERSNGHRPAKAKPQPPKHESEAEKKKRLAREEREMATRRIQRAEALKAKHDTLWLLERVAHLVAERLEISAGAIKYFVEAVTHHEGTSGSQWPEAAAIEKRIHKLAHADDPAQRLLEAKAYIVLLVLNKKILGWHKPEEAYSWARAQERCETLALSTFGVKLPSGWNKPPVHRTEYNCWDCGEFAPGTRITQRDHAAGWEIVTQGGKALRVRCPDCVNKTPAAPAKAGKGKKK